MNPRRPITLAAALIAAAAFSGGTALAATSAAAATPELPAMIVTDTGYGGTPASAQQNAVDNLNNDYWGCSTATLISDRQQSDGIWRAVVQANCKGAS